MNWFVLLKDFDVSSMVLKRSFLMLRCQLITAVFYAIDEKKDQ